MVRSDIQRRLGHPSHSLLSPSFLHLFSSVPQLFTSSPGLCVCVVVESVAGIQARRKCRHKHWWGSMVSPLLCLLTLLSVWFLEAAHSMTHLKHTLKNGTWTGRIHGRGRTCGTHIQFSHVCLCVCSLFVLHKSPQSCHTPFSTANNLRPV